VFVNHVTSNPFFVPTQYGIQDAAALLGVGYQWTGSQTSNAAEMVNDFNGAIAAKAGASMGERIVGLVDAGRIALFIATPRRRLGCHRRHFADGRLRHQSSVA
jgi:hypothetical protein